MATDQNKNENDQDVSKSHQFPAFVSDILQKINTEFPLSGSETDEDLEQSEHSFENNTIIHAAAEKVDETFPLSGAETDEDLNNNTSEPATEKEDHDEPQKHNFLTDLAHKVEGFIENLDTDFPLSGGE